MKEALGAPIARLQRWGDGVDAPAAGARNLYPQGFEMKWDVPGAIKQFGHTTARVEAIMEKGNEKAAKSFKQHNLRLLPEQAAALYAYTEEKPEKLYNRLNYAMRTPNSDSELHRYSDYLHHVQTALSNLPAHLSLYDGKVYRGIKIRVKPENYGTVIGDKIIVTGDERVTWQAFSSSTKNSTTSLSFVEHLPGGRLRGSLFIIESKKGKLISTFSAYEAEDEVLFDANSQFKVLKRATSKEEKRTMLDELSKYETSELDVYSLEQLM